MITFTYFFFGIVSWRPSWTWLFRLYHLWFALATYSIWKSIKIYGKVDFRQSQTVVTCSWGHESLLRFWICSYLSACGSYMLTGWSLASASMWDPSVLPESRNRPHVLIKPITGQNLDLTIIHKLCLLCSSWCLGMSWCQAIGIYIARLMN